MLSAYRNKNRPKNRTFRVAADVTQEEIERIDKFGSETMPSRSAAVRIILSKGLDAIEAEAKGARRGARS